MTLKKLLIDNVDEKQYRSYNCMNQSSLKNFALSYEYMEYRKNTPMTAKTLDFGTACHLAIFEPELYSSDVAISPEINKRTKEGKEIYTSFLLENKDKLILTEEEHLKVNRIKDKVNNHPLIGDIFKQTEFAQPERAFFHPIKGLRFKGRVDYIDWENKIIVDFKTTNQISFDLFIRDFVKYKYYYQHIIYSYLAEKEYQKVMDEKVTFDFYYLVASTVEPHHIWIYKMCLKDIELSGQEVVYMIEKYKQYDEDKELYKGEHGKIINDFILPSYNWNKYK